MALNEPLEWRVRQAPIVLSAADRALTANRMDMYGKMPLISTVEDDSPSFIKVMQLCRHGAIIDAMNKRGLSALCIASFRGLTSIVKPHLYRQAVMDIMCTSIDERFPQHTDINPDTRDLLHRRCCRACGKTTQNLEARHDTYMLGDMTGPEPQQNLHRCAGCPTDIFMGGARYCSRVCQKNDWAPGARTHRNVCPGTKGVVYRSR